ncbi:MAG: ribose-5-phosphate isomerase RpiA [Chitinophagaceae bacterium]
MLTKEEMKKLAAMHAIERIQANMIVGIGTGSTVYWFIEELARRVKEGLVCRCVPTSLATYKLATELGLSLMTLNEVSKIDLTVDGADEVDPALNLIKGGGGALLQEKMVAAASDKLIIIADSSKFVKALGVFPLPVEVIPYGWKQVQEHISFTNDIGAVLRLKDDQPYVTDHGHYILDCHFNQISDPVKLSISLHDIPGVVENGLFIKMANEAIIAAADGTVENIVAV